MAMDHNVIEALRLDSLTLPPSLDVQEVRVEEHTNADGEDSLRVLVVIGETIDPAEVSGADVAELKWQIRERLRAQGISLFAYIFLAKPSELQDHAGDSED
jgi:hypothetical protein